ncbi:hypothetical protein D3C77_561040 [compost metagenome]
MIHVESGKQSVSEELAVETQGLRDVIEHASQVGAVQTNISIELLTVLLAAYDKTRY